MSYADLVATATVGVSRRPGLVTELAGPAGAHAGLLHRDDPAVALLDAAALLVSASRAGVLPAAGITAPAPAGPDQAPELPGRAAGALELAWDAEPALLPDLLGVAAARGYLAPAPLLPALLDAAVKQPGVRAAVTAVLGARGRWLAGHRDDWRQAVHTVALVPEDPAVWQTGSRPERLAYLTRLRDRDPAAGRDLLVSTWAEETGDDRVVLLGVLARRLGAADEEFLEQALDDRKAAVRDGARLLLARLPGSAFGRRAAERAVPLLRLERSGPRRRLAVTAPEEVDRAAVRDGIAPRLPTAAIGTRGWLLSQFVAAVPLAEWPARFGLEPAELVSLPVTGDLAVAVRAGWRLAAVRQDSPAWARALLTAQAPQDWRPPAAWPADAELAAILPQAEQAARVTALLTGPPNPASLAAAAACPGPWPADLADALLTLLDRTLAGRGPAIPDHLLPAAARNLPVDGPHDYAAALARLALSEYCPPRWQMRLRQAARALALRRTFVEEIR